MASDPDWARIFGPEEARRLREASPRGSRVDTPFVRPGHEACPEHCVWHEVETVLDCPRCHVAGYQLLCHSFPWDPSHHWYSLVPIEGSAPLERTQYREAACRHCGERLRRRRRSR